MASIVKIPKDPFAKRTVGVSIDGPSRTQQQFKDDADVNKIIATYKTTGFLGNQRSDPLQYGDATGLPSLQEAMDLVLRANAEFAQLPATVRELCRNDPKTFLGMCETPHGMAALKAAGLPVREVSTTRKEGGEPPKTAPSEQPKTDSAAPTPPNVTP